MYIKEIKIHNFKCLDKFEETLAVPDGANPGSGLNILIGENNAGKTSFFEAIRKMEEKASIWPDEITNTSPKDSEFSLEIFSEKGERRAYESRLFVDRHSKDFLIHNTEGGFQLTVFFARAKRSLNTEIPYSQIPNAHRDGKEEEKKDKNDVYYMTNQIAKMPKDKREELSTLVNSFIPDIKAVYVEKDMSHDIATLMGDMGGGNSVPITNMGSGIAQFITLLWGVKFCPQPVLLLDEPEISLHPRAQLQLMRLLFEESKTRQILIATHSPYIFKDVLGGLGGAMIFKKENDKTKIIDLKKSGGFFPWSPSWGEINYIAYDIVSFDLHNELYGYIEEKAKMTGETFFNNNGVPADTPFVRIEKGVVGKSKNVPLPTYIRHMMHHTENNNPAHNPAITMPQIRKGIETMIGLLPKLPA